MADAPSAQSQSLPREAASQPGTCPPDCDLPENSKENLDARLDHAIEETFPTSDPISVTVTKQAVAEVPREAAFTTPSSQSRAKQDQAEQEAAETLLDQVREALQDVPQTASAAARAAYHEGQQYLRQARERYPQAEQYYQEGQRAISQRTAENPLMSLLLAAAAGYALAWMIHGQRRGGGEHVPDYGRINQSYIPRRDERRGR
ncbi:hypothetical protein [Microvirga yunnanensis]|uniref:hypothetical protein n=1 Tax=Microvirga yunnanensis TaxID=2953740 RepID=UPI0021C71D06|nr:hypothetical protein [Microvirga sp. HBU65207]